MIQTPRGYNGLLVQAPLPTLHRGNELFCEVDEDFITDQFNLYGLAAAVPGYSAALDVILDNDDEDEDEEDYDDDDEEEERGGGSGAPRRSKKSAQEQEVLHRNAEVLYGLIHARFILTSRGMSLMYEKYRQSAFGKCPRYMCGGQAVLPVGLSDVPRQHPVRLFCPRCEDVYLPKVQKHANIDGAYFGTSFPHMMLLQYPEMVPPRPPPKYVPKIFGFKIRHSPPQPPQQLAPQQQQTPQSQTQQQQQQQQSPPLPPQAQPPPLPAQQPSPLAQTTATTQQQNQQQQTQQSPPAQQGAVGASRGPSEGTTKPQGSR